MKQLATVRQKMDNGRQNTCGRRRRLQCKAKKKPNVSWTKTKRKKERILLLVWKCVQWASEEG
jgi:hypothetical protein